MHSLHLCQLLRACLDIKQNIALKQCLAADCCAATHLVLLQALLLVWLLHSLKVAGACNLLYCNSICSITVVL